MQQEKKKLKEKFNEMVDNGTIDDPMFELIKKLGDTKVAKWLNQPYDLENSPMGFGIDERRDWKKNPPAGPLDKIIYKTFSKEGKEERKKYKLSKKLSKTDNKAHKQIQKIVDMQGDVEHLTAPYEENTFQEDMQIEMDRAYQESIAPPGHYDAEIEFERNRDLQLELNNIYGFTLEIDGKMGPNTKKAVQLRDSLISKGLQEHDVREYIEGSRMGFPVHLLINGNQELYDKWKESKNPVMDLTPEEYKEVFPGAKTNEEYALDQFKNKASNWHEEQKGKAKDTINRIWDFIKGQ